MGPEKDIERSADRSSADRFGPGNWLLLAVGVVLLVVGFAALAAADQDAGNLPGRLSPFVILAGYATIFVGLILRVPPK